MEKEHKIMIIRLILSLLIGTFAFLSQSIFYMSKWVYIPLYITAFLLSGYDLLVEAVEKIIHFELLDEAFLMSVAGIGSFILGEYLDAVLLVLLFQLGEMLQDMAVDKSKKDIKSLLELKVNTVTILVDDKEKEIAVEDAKVGDIFVVRPGEKIALDGEIIFGSSNINTASLTGEMIPVGVCIGSRVLAGTINIDSVIKIKCESLYKDSSVAKIIDMVENASEKKTKSENFISKFAKIYTPIVVGLATLIAITMSVITGDVMRWVGVAITFLVVSCPCALVISVPLCFMKAIGTSAKLGVLFKGSNYIEALSDANNFVFDKTGTITEAKLKVKKIIPEEKYTEILTAACVCETFSSHPLAKCVLDTCNCGHMHGRGEWVREEISGKGIIARNENEEIIAGNKKLFDDKGIEVPVVYDVGSVIYVAKNCEYLGYIVVEDAIKESSKKAILALNKSGVRTVMLTGDSNAVAESVAKEVYIDEYKAELLPHQKVEIIESYINAGDKVAFVGDGINDAPSMMRADVGLSMYGIGSDVAIEASDIVVATDNLNSVVQARKIAKRTMKCVKINIIFAIFIKIAVMLLSVFNLTSLFVAILADVGVSLLCVFNAIFNVK